MESTDDFDSSLGSIEGVDDALESWGMSVPGVIGEDEDLDVPDKIEGADEEIPAEIKMEDQLSNELTSKNRPKMYFQMKKVMIAIFPKMEI